MLSDVLLKAVQEICTYQEDMAPVYAPLTDDLNMLVAEMDRIRSVLETQLRKEVGA